MATEPSTSQLTRFEVVSWTVLVLWLWGSRILVAPSTLIEWDSANYALALTSPDLFDHQPHPPGNPVFLALLWVGSAFPGVTAPFLFANAVLGTLCVVLIGWMVRPELGRKGAFAVGLGFSICAPFWFQGASSTAYVAEAAASVLGAAGAVAIARGSVSLPVAVVALAMAIGIRPNIAIVVLPLAALALPLARPKPRELVLATAVFGLACLTWLLPLLALGGGLTAYRRASMSLWRWQVQLGSIFGDGSIVWSNCTTLGLYLGDALHVLWMGVALNLAVVLGTRRARWLPLAFVGVWMLPGLLFFGLHHLPKSGYVLSLLPACFVGAALLYRDAAEALEGRARVALVACNRAVVVLWAVINLYGFGWSVPADLLAYRDAPIDLPRPVLLTGDYGRIGLAYRAWPHRRTAAILDELDDDRDLAVFLFGAHELMRVQMALRPNQWMAATSVDHGAAVVSRAGVASPRFGAFQEVVLEAPELGITADLPTRIRRSESGLELARPGRAYDLRLAQVPDRVLVFAPCPPCSLAPVDDLVPPVGAAVGGGVVVFELPAPSESPRRLK